jgi:hypothetical protein
VGPPEIEGLEDVAVHVEDPVSVAHPGLR